MGTISRNGAEHYAWGGVCDGWRLAMAPEFSVIEELMPAGAAEVRHHHGRSRQFFYVLSGRLTIEVDGQTHSLGPREGLEVAPGARHRAHNAGAQDAEFVLFSCPPTAGDRIEEG